MKKYNNFDRHMVLLGIIIPFLVFFISMNTTFAFFTATATKKESSATTATVQITFKTGEGISSIGKLINGTDSGEVKLVPGDTLIVNGTLTNSGSSDAYAVIEYTINIKKQTDQFASTYHKKYFTFVGDTLEEITGTTNNYSQLAGIITSKTSKAFTLPEFEFKGEQFGNEFKNATVEYVVRANAIQTANITQTNATNELMNNAGYNSTKVYGNSYQATGTGKNLAILEQGTLNYPTSGSEVDSTTRCRTNYIPVEYLQTYVASSEDDKWKIKNGAAFDENYNLIDYSYYPNISTHTITINNESVKYLRFIYANNDNTEVTPDYAWYQFELGDTATEYEPYTGGAPAPTPTNPSEIKSVGEKTGNLMPYPYANDSKTISGISYKVNGDGSITLNGTATASHSSFDLISKLKPILFKAGTYTLSGNSIPSGVNLWFREPDSDSNYISTINNKSATITLAQDTNMYSYISVSSGTVIDNVTIYPMLEEGTTASEYEPYGYKIPVNVQTKNLYAGIQDLHFEKNALNNTIDAAGTMDIALNTEPYFTPGTTTYQLGGDVFNIIKGKEFTISFQMKRYSDDVRENPRVTVYAADKDSNKGHIVQVYYNQIPADDSWHNYSVTMPAIEDVSLIVRYGIWLMDYSSCTYGHYEIKDLQIELGSTATVYEPYIGDYNIYLDQPLRSVGDVADYLDLETGTVVRNVGVLTLTGDEAWETYNRDTEGTSFTVRFTDKKIGFQHSVCSHFQNVDYAWNKNHINEYGIYSDHGTSPNWYFRAPDSSVTTVEQFKTWLETQYNNGNAVTIQYQLASPITDEKIINSGISIPRGSTVTINTIIAPSS